MTRTPWILLALALVACGGGDKPTGTNTGGGTPSGGTTDAEPPRAENDLATVDEGGTTNINMAVNDLVAIGCANTLFSQGLRIPEDLSIAGFGDVVASEHYRVPLTTIRQPKFRLGTAAVEAMMQLLRGQRPDPKRLPAELLVRQSTAPPLAKPQS